MRNCNSVSAPSKLFRGKQLFENKLLAAKKAGNFPEWENPIFFPPFKAIILPSFLRIVIKCLKILLRTFFIHNPAYGRRRVYFKLSERVANCTLCKQVNDSFTKSFFSRFLLKFFTAQGHG
jgi:hypothetical protein